MKLVTLETNIKKLLQTLSCENELVINDDDINTIADMVAKARNTEVGKDMNLGFVIHEVCLLIRRSDIAAIIPKRTID